MTIIGNLTNDPDLRTTQNGKDVCGFTVAVNRPKRNGQDMGADFFKVNAWEERGRLCKQYLSKGKKVCVIGSVSVRTYTGSDGTVRANLEVKADEVEFLSPKDDDSLPT